MLISPATTGTGSHLPCCYRNRKLVYPASTGTGSHLPCCYRNRKLLYPAAAAATDDPFKKKGSIDYLLFVRQLVPHAGQHPRQLALRQVGPLLLQLGPLLLREDEHGGNRPLGLLCASLRGGGWEREWKGCQHIYYYND